MPVQDILAPISLGELIDKITILQIKTQHLQSTALENVKKELQALESTLNNLQLNIDPTLIYASRGQSRPWKIEDDIREKERKKALMTPSFTLLVRFASRMIVGQPSRKRSTPPMTLPSWKKNHTRSIDLLPTGSTFKIVGFWAADKRDHLTNPHSKLELILIFE